VTVEIPREHTPAAPVLFLSSNFPPETNALANRTWEHVREWASRGGQVEVVAGPPHFPEGQVYEGYENRLSHDRMDGVDVLRVPMYVAANAGFLRRVLSFLSYMVSAVWFARRGRLEPGVVVASSPQFFAGLAGWLVSRRLRLPFVLEIRDLWPESIVDVGAMRRGLSIRVLEWIEALLYRSADHVVVVSPAFRPHVEACGVPADRITVMPNGVDLERFQRPIPAAELEALRTDLELQGKLVATYIGTVGMAHGLDALLEVARRCVDPDIMFLIVGAGAGWQTLHDAAEAEGLDNLRVIGKQPRERIRLFYAASDVSMVHLKDRPAFRKVIPSKMFESMAMRRPIVLGVRGLAREILEASGAGIAVKPDDAAELLAAVLRLKGDPELRERLGAAGAAHVREHFDRREIARRYWLLLQEVAASG
jgi:glycosyltransferase involved in cell wall biosynthesis